MFKINLFGHKPVNSGKNVHTESEQKKNDSAQSFPQNQSVSADLAIAYLCPSKGAMTRAQVEKELKSIRIRYTKDSFVSSDTMNKILDSIDYNNARTHVENIKFLSTTDFPSYNLCTFVDNGYLSSDKGIEAFKMAKNTFQPFINIIKST